MEERRANQSDILGHIIDMKETLSANSTDIRNIKDGLIERSRVTDGRLKGHGNRLTTLEQTSWTRGGAIGVVAATLAAALTWILGKDGGVG